MKNFKLNKVFLFIIIFNFLSGCGYQPLFNAENQKFSIKKFELEGNKRLGSLLKNNLITSNKEENNLTITKSLSSSKSIDCTTSPILSTVWIFSSSVYTEIEPLLSP